jgi:S-adenosylmethionine synthetase
MLPLEVVLSRKANEGDGPPRRQVAGDGREWQGNAHSYFAMRKRRHERRHARHCRSRIIAPLLRPADAELGDVWMQNPNGAWTIGGFTADTGLTGRKLAVDNYGPNIPLGGGCFSGKDATKVDRSAAYMARRIAVDYLKQKGAKEVYVHIAYAIGVAEPLMAVATIDGKQEPITGLRPQAPRDNRAPRSLRKPGFRETAKYGHFGNGFAWDK